MKCQGHRSTGQLPWLWSRGAYAYGRDGFFLPRPSILDPVRERHIHTFCRDLERVVPGLTLLAQDTLAERLRRLLGERGLECHKLDGLLCLPRKILPARKTVVLPLPEAHG